MGDEEKKNPRMNPYAVVVLICATASISTVAAALTILRAITDNGMCAIAVMAFAPVALAIGVEYFISKQPHRK